MKRIGGSTFALIPPNLVRNLHLEANDAILLEVKPVGRPAKDVLVLAGKYAKLPKFDRKALWGKYGER